MATVKSLKADVSSASPSSKTLYGGQFTFSAQLLTLNYFLENTFARYHFLPTGILNGLFVGVGIGGGTILGGLLVGWIGMRATYRIFAFFLALILMLFLGLQWSGRQENSGESMSSYQPVPNQPDDKEE